MEASILGVGADSSVVDREPLIMPTTEEIIQQIAPPFAGISDELAAAPLADDSRAVRWTEARCEEPPR